MFFAFHLKGLKPMLKYALALALGAAVVGCSPIENQTRIKTSSVSVGQQNIAGKGDAVLTIQNSESMPNAFGGADIFGRTRPTGTTTLYYLGMRQGKAQFNRRDVLIDSQKTTMNSSPVVLNPSSQTYYSGNVGGIPYSGSANTQAYPIVLPPNSPNDRVAGVRDMVISVPIGETVVTGGTSFTVLSATPNQVTYKLN